MQDCSCCLPPQLHEPLPEQITVDRSRYGGHAVVAAVIAKWCPWRSGRYSRIGAARRDGARGGAAVGRIDLAGEAIAPGAPGTGRTGADVRRRRGAGRWRLPLDPSGSRSALTLVGSALTSTANGTIATLMSPSFLAAFFNVVSRLLAAFLSSVILLLEAIEPVTSSASASSSFFTPQTISVDALMIDMVLADHLGERGRNSAGRCERQLEAAVLGLSEGRRDHEIGHVGPVKLRIEDRVGLRVELRRGQGLRFLRQDQGGRIDGRLHGGLGGISAAVVDRGADKRDHRNGRQRERHHDVAAFAADEFPQAATQIAEGRRRYAWLPPSLLCACQFVGCGSECAVKSTAEIWL